MTPIGELVWTMYCEGKPSVFALPRNNAIGLAARVAKSVGVTVFLKTKTESMRVRPTGIITVDDQGALH